MVDISRVEDMSLVGVVRIVYWLEYILWVERFVF